MFSATNRIVIAFIACAILFAIVLISALDQPTTATSSRIYTQPVHTVSSSAVAKMILLEQMVITAKRFTPAQVASAKKTTAIMLEGTRI